MLNKIWFGMLLVGLLYGPLRAVVAPLVGASPLAPMAAAEPIAAPQPIVAQLGRRVTGAALEGANLAVEICIGLVGVMVLWLGLLQVAKDAGLVEALARALRPAMRWLFPEVPDGHPAQGAMLMNISANVLGLDNAATPFGLQAMRELESLNPNPGTATNSMATFLAINNSSVTLVPIGVIAMRVTAKSEDPAGPLFGMVLATAASTIAAIFVVKRMERWRRFASAPPSAAAGPEPGATE